jgi:hypothetical protein
MINRRVFLIRALSITAAASCSGAVLAQTAVDPMLGEDEVKAQEYGYKADTVSVDQTKFPQHTVKQTCAGCEMYIDGPNNVGACPLFQNRKVAANGWCSAFG